MKLRQSRRPVTVGVLRKALKILDAVQNSPFGLSLDEISKPTGINKSTAYRLLAHLEREGYLIRDGGGLYLIGGKVVQLASHANPQALLRETARPILRELLKVTKETVNLGVLDGGMVLYVDVLESPYDFRLVSKLGMRRPVYATALGKALCAYLPAEELENILSSLDFQLFTPHSISTPAQFRKELGQVRQRGYAIDNEEMVLGARCVAAPVLNASREAVAAVSVAGPITRITKDKITVFVAAVSQAAEAIADQMGLLGTDSNRTRTPSWTRSS